MPWGALGPRGVFPGVAGRLGAPGELKGQHPSASHAAEGGRGWEPGPAASQGRLRDVSPGRTPAARVRPTPLPDTLVGGPAGGKQRWPGIRRGVRATGKGVAFLLLPYLLAESEFGMPGGLPCPPPGAPLPPRALVWAPGVGLSSSPACV